MTALERYIDDLVNNREPEEFGAFPKNESSWEELFELCTRLIAEIVTLRRNAAQQSVQLTRLRLWRAVTILKIRRAINARR